MHLGYNKGVEKDNVTTLTYKALGAMIKRIHQPASALAVVIILVSTVTAVILLSQQSCAISNGHEGDICLPNRADIEAVRIQIRPGMEGLALIDRQHQTICIYQYQAHRPAHEALVLLAARSFRYDVQLEDYNTAKPHPSEVEQLLKRGRTTGTAPGEQAKP